MKDACAAAARQVRPLMVDAAIYDCIRPMQFRDAPAVAALHHAAMGNSLWARLGLQFLEQLYRSLVNTPGFLAFVYEEDEEVRGFIAGSTEPDTMMNHAFSRGWFLLGPAALPRALDPRILRHLLHTRRYKAVSSHVNLPAPVAAESLFCSFAPALRGRRVAGAINKVLFEDLLSRGHTHVKVTTEVDNEGANRQLQSWGFVDCGRFHFYGKHMVTSVLDLEASPRVPPTGPHPMLE